MLNKKSFGDNISTFISKLKAQPHFKEFNIAAVYTLSLKRRSVRVKDFFQIQMHTDPVGEEAAENETFLQIKGRIM